MAGDSGTPLPRKLGIRERHRLALVAAPDNFDRTLGRLPAGVDVRWDLRGRTRFDVIVAFFERRARLTVAFPRLAHRLQSDGGLWIVWPKKASGRPTDLGQAGVRQIGLAHELVDNKICAVDDTWSALRFVYRLVDRPSRG